MDLPNPDSITGKEEAGTGGGELLHTEMDIDQSDVKQECLEYSMGVQRKAVAPPTERRGELDLNSGKLIIDKTLPDSSSAIKIVAVHRMIDQSDIVYYLLKVTPFSGCLMTEKLKIVSDGRPTPYLNIVPPKKNVANRKFKPNTYTRFSWITGSQKLNRMFCWPCILFPTKRNTWNFSGYNDLVHYIESAITHEQKQDHYHAVIALSKFQSDKIETIIISSERSNTILRHNEKVEQNRRVFRRLIDITCFLAKQEMPFLGHNESIYSSDRGNFIKCVNLVSKYDSLLAIQLQSDHKSVFRGVSDDKMKNNIVSAISFVIINKIKCEIDNCDFVALVVEETLDVSGCAQLCFILRYVTGTTLVERFLGFIDVGEDRNVENIAEVIINKLKEYNCFSKLVAQAYDGAVFMSNCKNEVQNKVKLQCPHAMFIWRSPHNFLLSKSCDRIPETRKFFHVLQSICNFFQASTKRTEFYNKLCDPQMPHAAFTRWDYNSQTTNVISSERLNLIKLFENITDLPDDWDGETVSSAQTFLMSLRDFEFMFFVHIFEQIFKRTDTLFEIVQEGTTDTCIEQIKQFECFMKDFSFDSNYTSAIDLTKEPERKRNIDDIKFHYLCIFQEIRDNILSEINARYGSIKELTFLELSEPEFFSKFRCQFPSKQLKKLESVFPLFFDFSRLLNELTFLYSSSEFAGKNLLEISEFFIKCGLNFAFPQIIKLASLLATIPASSASEKGSFSALKRIHAYLRSTRNQKQHSDLSIIVIEQELLVSLKSSEAFYDDVVSEFLKIEKRIQLAFSLTTVVHK